MEGGLHPCDDSRQFVRNPLHSMQSWPLSGGGKEGGSGERLCPPRRAKSEHCVQGGQRRSETGITPAMAVRVDEIFGGFGTTSQQEGPDSWTGKLSPSCLLPTCIVFCVSRISTDPSEQPSGGSSFDLGDHPPPLLLSLW